MKTIVVTAKKGGVGKTTITKNLLWHFIEDEGARVLAIDMDPQNDMRKRLHAFEGAGDVNALFRGEVEVPVGDRMRFSTETVIGELIDEAATDYIFEFRRNMARFAPHFDYCVIDTPVAWGMRLLAALLVCDHLLVPTELDELSMDGLQSIANDLATANAYRNEANKADINFLGIVLSRVQRIKEDQLLAEELRGRIGEGVFKTEFPNSKAIKLANASGVPLWKKEGLRAYEKRFVEVLRAFFVEVRERMELANV